MTETSTEDNYQLLDPMRVQTLRQRAPVAQKRSRFWTSDEEHCFEILWFTRTGNNTSHIQSLLMKEFGIYKSYKQIVTFRDKWIARKMRHGLSVEIDPDKLDSDAQSRPIAPFKRRLILHSHLIPSATEPIESVQYEAHASPTLSEPDLHCQESFGLDELELFTSIPTLPPALEELFPEIL